MPAGLVCPKDGGGGSGSVPARMEMKWFLNVRICLSTTFLLCFPRRTVFPLIFCCPSHSAVTAAPHFLSVVILVESSFIEVTNNLLVCLEDVFLVSVLWRIYKNGAGVICLDDHYVFVLTA